jgi:hypothetical protein
LTLRSSFEALKNLVNLTTASEPVYLYYYAAIRFDKLYADALPVLFANSSRNGDVNFLPVVSNTVRPIASDRPFNAGCKYLENFT